ncbi:serine hydrolase, partial [Stenotrophomonas maltophilia]|nr:serine hydrolase [Stenotrophomonas maltophilia]
MALAVIDGGKVVHVAAYGERNAAGEPLRTDTVMYAASLTKMAFGHVVAQLAQDARIALDASIATALDKPLPDYPPEPKKYADYSV